MDTVSTREIRTNSPEQTESMAAQIGANLKGGEVIELVSDLGGGKTTFTRGLARGARSADKVGSPTFTLSREYEAPNFVIAHFDFYRLSEAGIVADELKEVVGDPQYVTIVEWGDIVHDVLPAGRLTVRLELQRSGDEDRKITLSYPEELEYLVKGVQ